MEFLEKDLEQIIYDADRELLSERGLKISGVAKRQLRIGNYGVADLVTFDKKYCPWGDPYIDVTVYEFKKDQIGISTFLQSVNYVKGITTFFEERSIFTNARFNIVLVGKSLDTESSFIYLTDLFTAYTRDEQVVSSLKFYTYSYAVDGIKFKRHSNYNLTEYGFKTKNNKLIFS